MKINITFDNGEELRLRATAPEEDNAMFGLALENPFADILDVKVLAAIQERAVPYDLNKLKWVLQSVLNDIDFISNHTFQKGK